MLEGVLMMVQNTSKSAKTRARLIPGDIVSVQADSIKFAVIKVLAIDEEGVYGLLYPQLFMERPRIVNVHALQTSRAGPIHFALTHDLFALCRPEIITHKQVTDDELKDCPLGAAKNSDWGKRTDSEAPADPGVKNWRAES
jgi:hypothetical protein